MLDTSFIVCRHNNTLWTFCDLWHILELIGEERPRTPVCYTDRYNVTAARALATIRHNKSYLAIAPSALKDTHLYPSVSLPPFAFLPDVTIVKNLLTSPRTGWVSHACAFV